MDQKSGQMFCQTQQMWKPVLHDFFHPNLPKKFLIKVAKCFVDHNIQVLFAIFSLPVPWAGLEPKIFEL
jgi:hypothetical protein